MLSEAPLWKISLNVTFRWTCKKKFNVADLWTWLGQSQPGEISKQQAKPDWSWGLSPTALGAEPRIFSPSLETGLVLHSTAGLSPKYFPKF
jgi:hypothetical protein